MSYRHDRRRKLIRRYTREGWRELRGVTSVGPVAGITLSGPTHVFTAEPGTLPSVGGMQYAAHECRSTSYARLRETRYRI